MLLTPYRETLALPKITSLLVVATLARVPIAAGTVVLTLHVVQGLGMKYVAAGLVGAASTIGGSIGAPMIGRLIDRWGLRPILLLTTVAEVIYWLVAPSLPYAALLPVAAVGGFLALPAFSVARQAIAALTPESHRLPAFALDSMTTELSFMAGPALGVLIVTTAGSHAAMLSLAVGILLAGIGLWLLNPPVRAAHEAPVASGERPPRRSWLKPRFVAVLAVTMAATLVLSGTDVAVVATLRASGEVEWAGLVLSLWAFFSLVGGFLYGTVRRGLPTLVIFAPMAVLTIPVGLGGDHWWLLALLLIPAGALCAPTITASSDAISRMIPAAARGEAMGMHNSALTVGVALGAPLAGLAIDHRGPAWGFVAVGAVGVLVALLVLPTEFRRRRTPETPDPAAPAGFAPVPDAARSTDSLPTPDLPTPDLPTPDLPTPDLAAPDLPTPDLPTPDLAAPDLPTPDLAAPEPFAGPVASTGSVPVSGSRPVGSA
ncbi:MFS transporter [Actinoplanes hulinensis]|uniref:MFS transporter n=1 Tax=Actinoplanes hulinensis TaxID=1144547 RepID=A0ABS7AU74_9ACTN|nr:MFS transporter [Actinoplanes hulinensis]